MSAFLILLLALPLASCQLGVCTRLVPITRHYQTYTSTSYSAGYRCGFWNLSTCYRTQYRSTPVYQTYLTYETEAICCDGYTGDGVKCSLDCPNCAEPFLCLAPYLCACPTGCTEPPQNVTLAATGSDSLEMSWDPPPLKNSSIITTLYLVLFQGETYRVNATGDSVMVLESLTPFTTYNCCVVANTTSGASRAVCATQTTLQAVPGSVESVEVKVVNDSSLYVSWDHPLSPNGVITAYDITVTDIIHWTKSLYSVPSNVKGYLISTGIRPYVPYNVSVAASTSVGLGNSAYTILYTREGVPRNSPQNLFTKRVTATSATIEWDEMATGDLRGWFMSYQIGYSSTTSGAKECPPTSYNKTVSVVQKRYRVPDLDPRLQYCVWVAARTSVGVGPFTHALIPRYSNSEFTLLIHRPNCSEWSENELVAYADLEISRGIEQHCRCTFSTDYIIVGSVTCDEKDPNKAIVSGRLISTNDRGSSELIVDMEKWASGEQTVAVRHRQLRAHPASSDRDISDDDGSNDGGGLSSSGPLVGPVVGGVTVMFLLLSTALIGCMGYRRKQASEATQSDIDAPDAPDAATGNMIINKSYSPSVPQETQQPTTEGATIKGKPLPPPPPPKPQQNSHAYEQMEY